CHSSAEKGFQIANGTFDAFACWTVVVSAAGQWRLAFCSHVRRIQDNRLAKDAQSRRSKEPIRLPKEQVQFAPLGRFGLLDRPPSAPICHAPRAPAPEWGA